MHRPPEQTDTVRPRQWPFRNAGPAAPYKPLPTSYQLAVPLALVIRVECALGATTRGFGAATDVGDVSGALGGRRPVMRVRQQTMICRRITVLAPTPPFASGSRRRTESRSPSVRSPRSSRGQCRRALRRDSDL